MQTVLRSWAASAAGLLGLSLSYGLGSSLVATEAVSFTAWVSLYASCVLAFGVIPVRRAGPWRAATWLKAAFCAALFAAIFYGANGAVDALRGPHRAGPAVARSLDGLALWFVLFPGIVSVALGQALGVAVGGSVRPGST